VCVCVCVLCVCACVCGQTSIKKGDGSASQVDYIVDIPWPGAVLQSARVLSSPVCLKRLICSGVRAVSRPNLGSIAYSWRDSASRKLKKDTHSYTEEHYSSSFSKNEYVFVLHEAGLGDRQHWPHKVQA
jgi:hypothetical protein